MTSFLLSGERKAMRIGLPNVKLLKGASNLLFLLRENLARFEVVVSF